MNKLSFGMLKPDCLVRDLEVESFRRITEAGFSLLIQKRIRLSLEDVHILYGYASDKPFFGEMCSFLMSGDVVVFIVSSDSDLGAIKHLNRIIGYTDPQYAKPGTLRELGKSIRENIAHSTSDLKELLKSSVHFFQEKELSEIGFWEDMGK